MRFGIKKAAAVILMSIIFAGATAQTAQAYNLAPQSFQNFYNTASAGNLQGLQSMIYRGLSLESTNQNGDTAICVAIRSQDAIAYRTLKQAGADIEPSCLKKISDEQKDAFFEQNDPEYAVQRSKSQWSKTGTAVLIGGGVAAGVIALAASGGGSGGGHSDDSTPIAPTCEDNPCGEGCFNNLTCPAGQVCSSSNTCGGCESCAVKSECTSVANKCNSGCYTNLVCQAGYECAAKNECGGCESCTKKSICATNKCASGCYTDIGCGENKACTARNSCGGCTRCNYVNHPNANHCADFDTKNNICLRCRSGYTAVDGVCQPDKPSHCVKYDYTTKICSMCDAGYSLSSDQKSCIRDTDSNCTAANFPLTTPPTNANISSCYDGTTTRYKITSCKIGYDLSADGKSCVPNSSGGDTGTCNAANYPLTTKPNDTSANYTFCIDGTTTRYKITSCKTGYTLSSDKKSCDAIPAGTCTAANYPLTAKPANATSESCTDGSTTRYKITSCNQGYNLSADGKSCIESSESETCDLQLYPLISEPENAATDKCEDKSGTHYRILSCTNGTTLSTDKLSCVTNCDRTVYNLTECNNGKVCDTCTDSTGTYYKFNKCMSGFVQDGIQDTCIKEEVKTSDNDVVNNDNITVDDNGQIVQSSSPFSRDWLLGFTNYTPTGETVSSNLYNARDKEASITIKDTKTAGSRPSIIGLASIYLRTPIVINSYNNYKGEITISSVNQVAVYGIMTTGGAYNSYNGNGIIKLTRNTSSPNEDFSSGLTGMGVWLEGVDSISGIAERQIADESSFLYNAFGGTGLIHLESNKGNVRGMAGYNVINAANGGTGTIEIVANDGSVDGLTNVVIGTESYFTANAYGRNSTGNITITAKNNKRPVYGIGGMLGRPIYNAYGQDATGNITINGSGIGIMNGNNAANGGAGNITINSDDTSSAGQIIGMENNSSGLLYNALGAGSYGNITITVAGQSTDTVFGLKGMIDNGSIDGGVGRIIITDTGNNNIIGMNGGGNHKNSRIEITSNADYNDSKSIIGLTNIVFPTTESGTPNALNSVYSGQNYGDINITATGSGTVYGMLTMGVEAINGEDGNITIYRDWRNPDEYSSLGSETYGMDNMDSGGDLINKGKIELVFKAKPNLNQRDVLAGMFNSVDGYKVINYGTITVKEVDSDFVSTYAMSNVSSKNDSYNYGTVIGNMYNVNNAAQATMEGTLNVVSNNITNGYSNSIATSKDQKDKGYVYRKTDGYPLVDVRNGNFTNYGVIYGEVKKYNYYGASGIDLNEGGTISNLGYMYLQAVEEQAVINGMDNHNGDAAMTNYGTIDINTGGQANAVLYGTRAYWYAGKSTAINNGLINIDIPYSNTATAYGMFAQPAVKNKDNFDGYENISLINNKDIKITASNGSTNTTLYGIYADYNFSYADDCDSCEKDKNHISVSNAGNITIAGNSSTVYGIYGRNSIINNTGNITITGAVKDKSYGIYATEYSHVYNSGTISINGEKYTQNAADGRFIYIDETSSITSSGEIKTSSAFDTAALGGGKFVLGKDGKITAPEIKGDITADAGITSGGFDKTYSNKNAFSGKTDEVKLNSGSALFDAALKNNDLVMTMKDFDEVVDDKSLAAYLQRNYEAKRNEQLFNSLKFHATSAGLNSSLNQQLGFSLLPNFAQENMNVFRSLSNLVTDTMFAQDLTNERMMVGYDYLGQDRSSKGRVTGYENTANSSYFLADTKLNNRQRFGLGVALTRFNSDYDDDSSRKATFAQALGSYMHDFGNRWKYAGLLRIGYADGDYKRQSDNERVSGDTSDILYGFNNELRYNYDLGFMTLEPQVELNAYGYYQRKIKENDEKISALLVDGTNNLSIEAGAGLYAGKETVYGETGRVKARLGGSYYRELSQPYHTMRARVRDTDGYYLIESTDIFDRNRVIVRADITFSWKALDFYLRGSQFMEDKHTTVINAGIKFNF